MEKDIKGCEHQSWHIEIFYDDGNSLLATYTITTGIISMIKLEKVAIA